MYNLLFLFEDFYSLYLRKTHNPGPIRQAAILVNVTYTNSLATALNDISSHCKFQVLIRPRAITGRLLVNYC